MNFLYPINLFGEHIKAQYYKGLSVFCEFWEIKKSRLLFCC